MRILHAPLRKETCRVANNVRYHNTNGKIFRTTLRYQTDLEIQHNKQKKTIRGEDEVYRGW